MVSFCVFLLALGAFFLWGWLGTREAARRSRGIDVTQDAKARKGIRFDVPYPVPSDAYLEGGQGLFSLGEASSAAFDANGPMPRSRSEYMLDRERWPSIVRFFDPGATIRVHRVVEYFVWPAGARLGVYGTVTDGETTYESVGWNLRQGESSLK